MNNSSCLTISSKGWFSDKALRRELTRASDRFASSFQHALTLELEPALFSDCYQGQHPLILTLCASDLLGRGPSAGIHALAYHLMECCIVQRLGRFLMLYFVVFWG